MKKIIMVSILNVLLLGLINGCSTSSADSESTADMAGYNEYVRSHSPVKGPVDAEITLVDFSGFL